LFAKYSPEERFELLGQACFLRVCLFGLLELSVQASSIIFGAIVG